MTLRALLLGLLAVLAVALSDPYTSFNKSWGWNTVGHFPQGAAFFLVFFTIIVNLALKAVRKSWALRQAELMLIWCMLIVACVVPSDGLIRWWHPIVAGPAYVARRADIAWRDTALEEAPEALLLSKKPNSVAAQQWYEGRKEGGRFPWGQWLTPLSRWGLFMLFFYGATFFLCGILRKQWVDNERLQFPLARVPLEFTEGSAGPGWLPSLFRNRAFLAGVIATAAFRLLRAVPLFFGKDGGWGISIPLQDMLRDTPLEHLYMQNFSLWWIPIGFAYLVPADVSLSVWFFYLFGRFELQTASWLGSPDHWGGTYSSFMSWHQAGSYLVFTIGALYMARRHLWTVLRKALGLAPRVDDTAEPVSYGVGLWGFIVCSVAAIVWFTWYGMRPWVSAALFTLLMSTMLVHARIVAQSGLYITLSVWSAPDILHGLCLGRAFGAKGAVVAHMQHAAIMQGNTALLAPAAVHAFRIGEVFERRRRWLLPVLFITLFVAIAASSWTSIYQGYNGGGALNYYDTWGQSGSPKWAFDQAHMKMERPSQTAQARWVPFGLGVCLTAAVMFMRAHFYWWPIHSIGLVAIANWHADRLWLPFLLGWLTKMSLMKLGSGKMMRGARFFFIGLIMVESFVGGISTIVVTLSKGTVPGF